jgi:hypothetical protein
MSGWPSPTREEDLYQPGYFQDPTATGEGYFDSPEIPKGELKPDEYGLQNARRDGHSRDLPISRPSTSTSQTTTDPGTSTRKLNSE